LPNGLSRDQTRQCRRAQPRQFIAGHRENDLVGAGQQGRAHVEALHPQHRFNSIAVVDTADVSAWCAEAAQRLQCTVVQTYSDEAIVDADLVLTTSRSKTPVFDGEGLKAGATVVAMGVSLPTGRELDDATLRRASRVVVEWQPQSLHEAGEVVLGLASGALDADRIIDLPALYRQAGPWRQHASDIIVFKSVGVGLSDAAVARLIWQRWLARQHGQA
jgi:ornithine cyclodeaminase